MLIFIKEKKIILIEIKDSLILLIILNIKEPFTLYAKYIAKKVKSTTELKKLKK